MVSLMLSRPVNMIYRPPPTPVNVTWLIHILCYIQMYFKWNGNVFNVAFNDDATQHLEPLEA